jgi:hypothetical protein
MGVAVEEQASYSVVHMYLYWAVEHADALSYRFCSHSLLLLLSFFQMGGHIVQYGDEQGAECESRSSRAGGMKAIQASRAAQNRLTKLVVFTSICSSNKF